VSEKKFLKNIASKKFFLYHTFIPTSAVVFITISSAWSFWRLLCWALYVCAFFFETVFGGLGTLDTIHLRAMLRLENTKVKTV